MYTLTLLSLLFTTSTMARPRPQCMYTPVPSVCIPPTDWNSPSWLWPSGPKNKENKNKLERDLGAVARGAKAEEEEPMAGVYYCEDVAWGGACQRLVSPLGSDPSDCTPIDDRASSIGPDPGYYCIFYTNSFCAPIASDGSDTLTLTYPGSDNLGFTEKGDFNDKLRSYHCFKKEDFTLNPDIGTPPTSEEEGVDV